MRKKSRIISNLVLISLVLTVGQAVAQPPSVTVESSAEPLEATMGDRITYRVIINAPAGITVTPPSPGENLGKFEIRDYAVEGPVTTDGLQRYEAVYGISIYEVGEHIIPPVRVRYVKAEGQEATIDSQAITIKVKSLAPEDGEFRDIKTEQEKVRDLTSLYTLLAIVGGLAALIVVIVVAVKKLRKPSVRSLEPERPAHIVAYEELNRLKSSDLLESGQIKEYHVQLALIIKTYISRRFDIMTVERTSEEIMTDCEKSEMAEEVRSMLRRFLDRCDLVKFAAMAPVREEIESTWELGKTIIDETRFRVDLLPLTSAPGEAVRES